MAEWNGNPSWTPKEQINGGEQFNYDSIPTPEDFNALVENMQYLYTHGGDFEVNPYPIGTVYMSFNGTSPASLFGGSWTQLKSKFLLASSNTATSSGTPMYNSTTTGGSADAVVVEHAHRFPVLIRASASDYTYATPPTSGSSYDGIDTVGTYETGESGVGKNMPPYQVVYMWRRVS